MTDPAASATTSKVAEMITGALERLVDARMFVLGMTFLWYLDIWVINFGIDPTRTTFPDVLDHLKTTPLGTFVVCIGLYSFLMAVVVPGLRFVWVAIMTTYGPYRRESKPLTDSERQLSNWAFFLVTTAICDWCKGFTAPGTYNGISWYLIDCLSGDGVVTYFLRVASVLSFLGCLILALKYES
jgi:hypothetical protein